MGREVECNGLRGEAGQHKKVATARGATDCLPIGGAGVERTV